MFDFTVEHALITTFIIINKIIIINYLYFILYWDISLIYFVQSTFRSLMQLYSVVTNILNEELVKSVFYTKS